MRLANERRNQLPPVLAKSYDLLCALLAAVLAPDGLSRLSCWLRGVGGAVVAYYNEIDPFPGRVGRLRAYGNAVNIEAATAFIKSYMAAEQ